MKTVVFVHGTGVRKDAYNESFKVVSELGKLRGVSVKPCYWGHLGSDLRAGGASIPKYDSTRALEDSDGATVTDEEYIVALWGVLYEDPLYELRVLAVRMAEVRQGRLSKILRNRSRPVAIIDSPKTYADGSREGGCWWLSRASQAAVT